MSDILSQQSVLKTHPGLDRDTHPDSSRTFRYQLLFGAELQPDSRTLFRIWAPSCSTMQLRLDGETTPMLAEAGGWHSTVTFAPAGSAYSYVMPDGTNVPDPASRMQHDDVHGPSVVIDPTSYRWLHSAWTGRPWHEAVIYELHVGLEGGFNVVRERLPELAALGVTAIELMPLSDVPGKRNWGYDGVLPFAPDRMLGTPDELKALIDAAHGLNLMVMLDVVYNHFGPDGSYIHAFAKPFFRDDVTTPWGASIDFRRHEVRDYFIQNAMYWIEEFRIDGLRFDAAHAITEEDFLHAMAGAIRDATLGRHVHLVLEHEGNRAALLAPGLYDAQWADDLHHCLHVLLTGEHEGYYQDFQDATHLLARCLSHGFAYEGQIAPHMGQPRGEPSAHLPTTAFVVCLQNHDQIGNRAFGERLTTLSDLAALRAATAFLLLSPFVPMLFMGEEWASTSPFQFFTSHNEELAGLVDAGRRNEFKAFTVFQDEAMRDKIPAPNAQSTFDNSRPERTDPAHATWISELLRLRRDFIMPGLPGCRSLGATVLAEGAVRADWAMGTGSVLTLLLNLGSTVVHTTLPSDEKVLFVTAGVTADRLPPNGVAVLLG